MAESEMQRPTILLDTSPLSSGHTVRGIGQYTRALLAALKKRTDINVIASPELKRNPALQYDLIHYPFYDFFFSTLPLKHNKPVVVTVHDVIPLVFSEHYKPGIKGMLRSWKQQFALHRVQGVITDSRASQLDITKYLKIPLHKISVTHLAAEDGLAPATESEIERVRRLYKLPKKYILYVGDISYNKNIPQLIKSLLSIPDDISLVCMGRNFEPKDIPEWRWIEAQMEMSEVTSRVRFVTDVPMGAVADVSAIFSGAIAYVQPSLYEGFGLPVLEAMQCKTPVVCTHTSSLIEVGGEHVVFVEPTAESMAEGVKKVMEWSDTARQRNTAAAYKWSQQFSWDKTAEETVHVYKKILGL
jgi:glycosyltransferase involved in cell wall biosynthesis